MFKFFEKVIEFFSMILIALSPIIIFTLIGITCYYSFQSVTGIIIGSGSVIFGLILGIWLAIHSHKKQGATEFNSRIHATPELDEKEKK